MKKTGTVKSLNMSPKGFYEGAVLTAGKETMQVNFPKEEAQHFADALTPGAEVSLEVEPEESRGTPAHPVFRLVHLSNGHAAGEHGPKHKTFSGRVERLNYALHGEVNGGILDSGDFLHLKPEGARAVDLKTGMEVEGQGPTKPMAGGHVVIEAEEVNGVAIKHGKPPKKHAK